jgi:L-lysine exporter family protein LysE/ArgO
VFTIFITYFVFGLVLSLTPGAMTVQMVNQGLRKGFLNGWFVGLGGMTVDISLIAIVYFGFSYFLTYPSLELILWGVGCVFLFMIALDSLKDSKKTIEYSDKIVKKSLAKSFSSGFLMAISPANVVFWLGIFGPLLLSSLQGAEHTHFFLVALGIIIGILTHDVGLMSIIHFTRKFLNQTFFKWSAIIASVILFGFSVYFGYEFINQFISYI